MLSAEFENREVLAAFNLLNLDPWILPSIWGSYYEIDDGISSLEERGLLKMEEGGFEISEELDSLIRCLADPDALMDFMVFENGGSEHIVRRTSFIVRGDRTYLMSVLPDRMYARELPNRNEILELMMDQLGEVGHDGESRVVFLSALEWITLLLILTLDIYGADVPGSGEFSLSDLERRVSDGGHIPLIAQMLLAGGSEDLAGLFSDKSDLIEAVNSLRGKGILEGGNDRLSVSDQFLPFALAIGSPDRVAAISVVRGPESSDPNAGSVTIFQLGGITVLSEVLDPREGEVSLMRLIGQDQLQKTLEELLNGQGILATKRELASELRNLLEAGDISWEEYEDAVDLFHLRELPLEIRGIRCPSCGHLNDPNAKFCVRCGSPLSRGEAGMRGKYCPRCGAPLRPGAKFCVRCGARVG